MHVTVAKVLIYPSMKSCCKVLDWHAIDTWTKYFNYKLVELDTNMSISMQICQLASLQMSFSSIDWLQIILTVLQMVLIGLQIVMA